MNVSQIYDGDGEPVETKIEVDAIEVDGTGRAAN
jgi:hypothetical protein